MYAHAVIEDSKTLLEKTHPCEETWKYAEMMAFNSQIIRTAHQFYLGEWQKVRSFFDHMVGKMRPFFEFSHYLRLPYPLSWFDWDYSYEGLTIEEGSVAVTKRGALATTFRDEESLIALNLYGFSPAHRLWTMMPVGYFVSIGKTFSNNQSACAAIKNQIGIDYSDYESHVICIPWIFPFASEQAQKQIFEDQNDLLMVHFGLLLLNCKDVDTKKVCPPAKLNKKRLARGKGPLFTYHILKLPVPKAAQRTAVGDEPPQYHLPLHFCRAHPAYYGPEGPLFGKWVGLFWRQAHLRGRDRTRMALKDYELDLD